MFLGISLAVVLFFAVFYYMRDGFRRHRERHYIYRCKECGYIYLMSKNMPMQNCPKCGHLNKVYRKD